MNFNQSHISAMEKRYRTTFINSLPGYKSLHMLGTVNKYGISNLGLFNSIFHVGADSPLLGMVFRPDSNDHDSLNNTKILIGEIIHVLMDDGIVAADGYVDHLKAGTVTVTGLDSYFLPHELGRLPFAKFT